MHVFRDRGAWSRVPFSTGADKFLLQVWVCSCVCELLPQHWKILLDSYMSVNVNERKIKSSYVNSWEKIHWCQNIFITAYITRVPLFNKAIRRGAVACYCYTRKSLMKPWWRLYPAITLPGNSPLPTEHRVNINFQVNINQVNKPFFMDDFVYSLQTVPCELARLELIGKHLLLSYKDNLVYSLYY